MTNTVDLLAQCFNVFRNCVFCQSIDGNKEWKLRNRVEVTASLLNCKVINVEEMLIELNVYNVSTAVADYVFRNRQQDNTSYATNNLYFRVGVTSNANSRRIDFQASVHSVLDQEQIIKSGHVELMALAEAEATAIIILKRYQQLNIIKESLNDQCGFDSGTYVKNGFGDNAALYMSCIIEKNVGMKDVGLRHNQNRPREMRKTGNYYYNLDLGLNIKANWQMLTTHIQRVNRININCAVCEMFFPHQYAAEIHRLRVHAIIVACRQCSFEGNLNSASLHLGHSVKCNTSNCSSSTNSTGELNPLLTMKEESITSFQRFADILNGIVILSKEETVTVREQTEHKDAMYIPIAKNDFKFDALLHKGDITGDVVDESNLPPLWYKANDDVLMKLENRSLYQYVLSGEFICTNHYNLAQDFVTVRMMFWGAISQATFKFPNSSKKNTVVRLYNVSTFQHIMQGSNDGRHPFPAYCHELH